MLDDNPLHQHGLSRDLFEGIEIEELYMLAVIGYHYIREKEQDLKAHEQSMVGSGMTDKEYSVKEKKEADRLSHLFYERRNGECKAKETAMQILAKYKSIKMSKMLQNLKKEREEEKK